jgi:hypothetical protein
MTEDIPIPTRSETENSRMVAGALFDFIGFLTSLEEEITFSSHHEVQPAISILQKFAYQHKLSLEEADVLYWQEKI